MDAGEFAQPVDGADTSAAIPPAQVLRPPFGAGVAFIVFGLHLATQFFVSTAVLILVPMIAGPLAVRRGVATDDMVAHLEFIMRDVGLPLALILAFVMSVLVMLVVAQALIRREPHPTFAEAVGWRPGSEPQRRRGLMLGATLGLLYGITATFLLPLPENSELGPLAQMAMQGGLQRMLWATLAIVGAPPVEEFLYRGVLYTGMARSWGVWPAAVLTCVIFASLHLTEVQFYWPALPFVVCLAVVVQAVRMRTGALGPCIMVHAAYNGVLVLLMYMSG